MSGRVLLVCHAAATWSLVGLAWTILIVQYPLFARVDAASFPAFHAAHAERITLVVLPAMLAELACAVWLVARPLEHVSRWAAWTGLAATVVVWLVTAFWSVPCHDALARGFSAEAHRSLLWSHAVRTLLWSLRGGLAAAWLL